MITLPPIAEHKAAVGYARCSGYIPRQVWTLPLQRHRRRLRSSLPPASSLSIRKLALYSLESSASGKKGLKISGLQRTWLDVFLRRWTSVLDGARSGGMPMKPRHLRQPRTQPRWLRPPQSPLTDLEDMARLLNIIPNLFLRRAGHKNFSKPFTTTPCLQPLLLLRLPRLVRHPTSEHPHGPMPGRMKMLSSEMRDITSVSWTGARGNVFWPRYSISATASN